MSAMPDSTFAHSRDRLIAELQRQLAERTAERDEALVQQTATAEVLQVINSSPGDLAPVFDAILRKAHTLCGAPSGGLIEIEGNRYRAMAVHGEPEFTEYWLRSEWIEFATDVPDRLRRGEIVHAQDCSNLRLEPDQPLLKLLELSSARSLLLVPLIKDESLFGAIVAGPAEYLALMRILARPESRCSSKRWCRDSLWSQ